MMMREKNTGNERQRERGKREREKERESVEYSPTAKQGQAQAFGDVISLAVKT